MRSELININKITLIIPAYNCGVYLTELIDSLTCQTNSNFLALFVYDESKDNTIELINNAIALYPSLFKLLFNKSTNKGPGPARNFALENYQFETPYIGFIDSDDYVSPLFVDTLLNNIEQNDADISICGFQRFDSSTKRLEKPELCQRREMITINEKNSSLITYLNSACWNKIYKTEIAKSSRFAISPCSEDVFFFLECISKSLRISFVPEVMYYYRMHYGSVSMTTTYDNFMKSFETIYDYINEHEMVVKQNNHVFFASKFFYSHCLSLVVRGSIQNKKYQKEYIRKAYVFMNDYFPKWWTYSTFKLNNQLKYGKKTGFAFYLCKVFYRLHLFGFVLLCLRIYILLFNKKKRW